MPGPGAHLAFNKTLSLSIFLTANPQEKVTSDSELPATHTLHIALKQNAGQHNVFIISRQILSRAAEFFIVE